VHVPTTTPNPLLPRSPAITFRTSQNPFSQRYHYTVVPYRPRSAEWQRAFTHTHVSLGQRPSRICGSGLKQRLRLLVFHTHEILPSSCDCIHELYVNLQHRCDHSLEACFAPQNASKPFGGRALPGPFAGLLGGRSQRSSDLQAGFKGAPIERRKWTEKGTRKGPCEGERKMDIHVF